MLPLGLRVQEKLERLIDKHMNSLGKLLCFPFNNGAGRLMTILGASKLSLSSLSSQALWKKSGRLQEGSEVIMVLTLPYPS
jgi:prolyl-tRNA synthetase